ncbi:MAG: nucleoside transporter C-terminal domain-containing protein [Thiohalocapsa sp.]
MSQTLHGLLGLCCLLSVAWLFSEDRRHIPARLVLGGLALQFVLALLLLKLPAAQALFIAINGAVLVLQQATEAGTSFVFGHLGGGQTPYDATYPENSFVLAFRALPIVLVIGALAALLFHWRVLPMLVHALAGLLRHSLGIGGALGLGVAANVFIGMVESPLLIKPYLRDMSRGALFALMTTGMATIAGTVMVLYATLIGDAVPNAMGHILTASLISAPAALVVAGLMIPDSPNQMDNETPPIDQDAGSAMDAITRGTLDAIPLMLNIMAMLVVMVALVSIVNSVLGWLPAVHGDPLTLQRMLGWIFAPLVWLIGIPWDEAAQAGQLMGIKTVLNELLAYLELASVPPDLLSERSRLIMTYALCGFANFGSLGIMIGGLGSLAPERRAEVVGLGIRSILAGTLTTLMTAAMVGMLI